MARTAIGYGVPAAIVLLGWLRLESGRADGWTPLALVALALVPALLPTLALRLLTAGPVTLVAGTP